MSRISPGYRRHRLPAQCLPPAQHRRRCSQIPWTRSRRRRPSPPCAPHLLLRRCRREHQLLSRHLTQRRFPLRPRGQVRRQRRNRQHPHQLLNRPPRSPRLRCRPRQSAPSTRPLPGGIWSTATPWNCRTRGGKSGREDTPAPHHGADSKFLPSTSLGNIPWTSSPSWCCTTSGRTGGPTPRCSRSLRLRRP